MGQGIWLNLTDREVLSGDKLCQLISRGELSGVNFNLAGLVQAISGFPRYRCEIVELAGSGKELEEIYKEITVKDVRTAADLLLPLYEATGGSEGLVSVDIAPDLSFDTEASAEEATDLWQSIDRPNVLIKVPATQECLPTIQYLVREGVNVHVATLFTVARYRDVAHSYVTGLRDRHARGVLLDGIASVAAFSLSTVNRFAGGALHRAVEASRVDSERVAALSNKVFLATAKVAYQTYKETFSSEEFRRLAADGARPQRLLWMMTNGRDPAWSYVRQKEGLTGPATIACLPFEALELNELKSGPGSTLEDDITDAYQTLRWLFQPGTGVDEWVDQLEQEVIKEKLLLFDRILIAIEGIAKNNPANAVPEEE